VPETRLVFLQRVRVLLEQPHGLHDQVVEIEGVVRLQAALVLLVDLGHLLLTEIVRRLDELLRRGELVLQAADARGLPAYRWAPQPDRDRA
jgi:hypothetical protein